MPKLTRLTDEQAQDQLNWLMHQASREVFHAADVDGETLTLDAAGMDKLREIEKVAKNVAHFFEEKNAALHLAQLASDESISAED